MTINVGVSTIDAIPVGLKMSIGQKTSSEVHALLEIDETVISQFLTTNPSGFLRDCSNMLQGIILCIERLEKGFKNVDAGTKDITEVIQQFKDKIQNLKAFEIYDVLLDKKIFDALTQRAKITEGVEEKKSTLVSKFRAKCSTEDISKFDAGVVLFNSQIETVKARLASSSSPQEARGFLQSKIPEVRGIVELLEGLISGKQVN